MGILDGLLGTSLDDPRTMATMQLAQGLLSGPKALPAISQGLLGYGSAMAEAKKQAAAQQMQQLQMEQHQEALKQAQLQRAAQERQQAFLQGLQSPQQQAVNEALAGGMSGAFKPGFGAQTNPALDAFLGGGTKSAPAANAPQLPKQNPQQDMLLGAVKAGVMPIEAYLNSIRKDKTPIKLAAGESLIDQDTFKPLFTNPKDDAPSALKEYQFAVSQGEKRSFTDWQAAMKRAGAPSVNVNTAKPLLNTVAEGLGKQLDSSLENARAAQSAINTAQSLKAAVDSGKVVSGPGATFRVAGLQLGQTLGIGGKDAAETLGKTRQAIQSMAQAELDAAAQMKGQGQITEAERGLIKRAAAGDIDGLTGPEIRQLADVMEKTARYKIKSHQANVQRLKAMPEAAPLIPFYQMDEPPAYATPSAGGGVRRYNPATGKIE